MIFLITEVSDLNAEGPPVPIPNTEVKLCCGENTWREAAREDSSVPTQCASDQWFDASFIPLLMIYFIGSEREFSKKTLAGGRRPPAMHL